MSCFWRLVRGLAWWLMNFANAAILTLTIWVFAGAPQGWPVYGTLGLMVAVFYFGFASAPVGRRWGPLDR